MTTPKKTQDDVTLTVGVALGSGGAKGLAHIGVLKVLERYGIIPDYIVGASMGAVIGAAYALGVPLEEIEKKSHKLLTAANIFSLRNVHFFHESFIRAKDLHKAFYEFVQDREFKDCKIPFMALALDLESGEEIALNEGKIIEAVKASSAIPGVFPPVFINGQYLVDGGLLNPTPVDYLREKNMDIAIGVHTTNITSKQFISAMIWDKFYKKPKKLQKKKHNLLEQAHLNMTLMLHIMLRTIEIVRRLNARITFLTGRPDVIVSPYTMDIGFLQFERVKEAISFGEQAMEKEMPRLLKAIERKKEQKKMLLQKEGKEVGPQYGGGATDDDYVIKRVG